MRRPSWIALHDYGLFDVQPAVSAFVQRSGYHLDDVTETLAGLRCEPHPARSAARKLLLPIKRVIQRVLLQIH